LPDETLAGAMERRTLLARYFLYVGGVLLAPVCDQKVGFRYRLAETAGIAAVERLKRTAGLASAVTWPGKTHVYKHFGVEKPTQKLRSFFSRQTEGEDGKKSQQYKHKVSSHPKFSDYRRHRDRQVSCPP
jgi:hypothetical protein